MSGSYFALNSKYNTLLALFNSIIIPSPPLPPTADIMTTNTAQTVTAIKTFSVLPQSSVVPTLGDQLVNKTYADATANDTTLQQVLTAGSTAQAPLTITLNDTPNNVFTILSSSNLEVDFDDGITPNNATYQSDGISHSGDALFLQTNGLIGFSSNNIVANSATFSLTATNDGYNANPNFTINATSATAGTSSGVPSVQYYKSGRNGANNDIIGSQQFFAKNSTGVKTEFAKIETLIRNVGVGNDDGSIGFFATLNGVSTEFMRINGADGDNNFLKPLDMNGSAINSSSGSLSISTFSSTGTGNITATAKGSVTIASATDVILVSNTLTMATDKPITLTNNLPNLTTTTLGNGELVINDTITSDTATFSPALITIENDFNPADDLTASITPTGIGFVRTNAPNQQNFSFTNDSASGGTIDYTNTIGTNGMLIRSNQSVTLESTAGLFFLTNLPTSIGGLPTGALWNNSGVLSVT